MIASLTEWALTNILNYGAPALALAILLGAIGVPFPTTLLVIAGGAFIRQELLDFPTMAMLALASAVLGDSLSYGIGHFASLWTERKFGATPIWSSAKRSFASYGGWSIFLSRFVLTSIAIPINLLAGSTSYRYRRFLPLVFLGETTWIVLFGALGYIVGSQWEEVSTFVSDFGGALFGLVLLAAGFYLAYKWLHIKPALNSN